LFCFLKNRHCNLPVLLFRMATSNRLSSFPVSFWTKSDTDKTPVPDTIKLSTLEGGVSELILDYGRAVGGIPFFESANVQSEDGAAVLEIIYSETRAGIDREKGTVVIFESPTTC